MADPEAEQRRAKADADLLHLPACARGDEGMRSLMERHGGADHAQRGKEVSPGAGTVICDSCFAASHPVVFPHSSVSAFPAVTPSPECGPPRPLSPPHPASSPARPARGGSSPKSAPPECD